MTIYERPGQPLALHPSDAVFGQRHVFYKNLNNGLWSVTHLKGLKGKGLLEFYADRLFIRNCQAVVSEKGLARIRRKWEQEGKRAREVVAWFTGEIDPTYSDPDWPLTVGSRVTLHPYDAGRPWFFNVETDEQVWQADAILLDQDAKAYLVV